MKQAPTPGVLLRGADGSHYFIPHTDLSAFAVPDPTDEVSDHVEANAPRLDAFSVQQPRGAAPATTAIFMVEGQDKTFGAE